MASQFRGEFYFLSNMYPCEIRYDGITYSCVESAYQAQKTLNYDMREAFSLVDGFKAKQLGRKIILREDWEVVKVKIMVDLVTLKFNSLEMHDKLDKIVKSLSLIGKEVVEFNDHHDNFYGYCTCIKCKDKPKLNKLGRILTKVGLEPF